MSRNTTSTQAGDVNRKTSQDLGRTQSGSNAEFGENIGRSENWSDEPSSRSSNSGSMSGSGGRRNLESDVSEKDSNTGRH
jgi:hypothetical protein